LFDDFGRHPVGCADHGGALGALFGQLGTETEIGWEVVSFNLRQ
jgi:hypothetical protein